MITYQQALARVAERLPVGEMVDDRWIMQNQTYWIFASNNITYLLTGDPMSDSVSNLLYLVNKQDGEISSTSFFNVQGDIQRRTNPDSQLVG